MTNIERQLDRYLLLLRSKMREKGFTQLEVQESLGWGRSYLSQLLTKQKTLRFEQVFSILRVIGVEPREFFTELVAGPPQSHTPQRQPPGDELSNQQLEDLSSLLQGMVKLLIEKKVITAAELSTTIQVAEAECKEPN